MTSIGEQAFEGCNDLTSVEFHCKEIGSWFNWKQSIQDVIIGDEVTSIGKSAFSGCSDLTSVTIGNSVTSIGDHAFSGCSGLTSVTIPNSVTSIGSSAFYGCSGLTSITIPNSVTSIGYRAFEDCSCLTSITIPNSVTSIGDYAFYGCSGLTSITIPNSVTSIGETAFCRCSGLTSIVVESGNLKYDSRGNCNAIIETANNTLISGCKNTIIPNSVTSIGWSAFGGCSGLASITIPNSVTSIEYNAFNSCSSLTSVTIPNSVTSIQSGAFADCSGLTSVTIGNSVTRIGKSAFYGCSSLTSVTSLNPIPPTLDNRGTFNNYSATLQVPTGSKTAYQNAEGWKNFTNIVEIYIAMPTHKLTYIVDGEVYRTYDIEERATITPEPEPTKEGYIFSGWSEIPETMPNHDVTVTGTFTINSQDADVNYVDLGLPSGLLWATCNLGASSPEEVGGYYAWGETSPKTYFSEDNYQYKNNPISISNISGTEYDAAHITLRGTWRMPTKAELEELAKYCTRTQITLNGTICMQLIGPNGNKLIIARGGLGEQGSTHEDGYGLWSSTPNTSSTAYRAWEWTYISYSWRWQGIPIRPVTSEEPADKPIKDIAINEENFPDEAFRKYLMRQDYGEDGIITIEELDTITSINVSFYAAITNLKGIENFTKLSSLECQLNLLTNLDVSKNTALTHLNCISNRLTSLVLPKSITRLKCGENQLTSLDVSNNTALTYLSCDNNELTSLDLSNNTALDTLSCGANKLTTLDVSKNTALKYLECSGNELTSFVVSNHTALHTLYCNKNKLVTLDVSNNPALEMLSCCHNQLVDIDVTNDTALNLFDCYGNQLTSLDVSTNSALGRLSCKWNKLTSLNVSKNNRLVNLNCIANYIKDEAMDVLVGSLPVRENANFNGYFYVIDLHYEGEGNVCTKTQVQIAKEKGWTVWAIDSYGGEKEYEGSDPSGIQNITLDKDINAPIYDLNGRKLKEPRNGINIIGRKKIIIK